MPRNKIRSDLLLLTAANDPDAELQRIEAKARRIFDDAGGVEVWHGPNGQRDLWRVPPNAKKPAKLAARILEEIECYRLSTNEYKPLVRQRIGVLAATLAERLPRSDGAAEANKGRRVPQATVDLIVNLWKEAGGARGCAEGIAMDRRITLHPATIRKIIRRHAPKK
jgi:hypothetical protein